MTEPIPYTVVFHWDGMPPHGAGPVSTVWKENGVLPATIVDPIEQGSGEPMKGTWHLDGTDENAKLAIYNLT